MPNLLKLAVTIAGVVHEIGEYAPPIVDLLLAQRAKGPSNASGQEETVDVVRAKLRHVLDVANAIQTDAQGEIHKLDQKQRGA